MSMLEEAWTLSKSFGGASEKMILLFGGSTTADVSLKKKNLLCCLKS